MAAHDGVAHGERTVLAQAVSQLIEAQLVRRPFEDGEIAESQAGHPTTLLSQAGHVHRAGAILDAILMLRPGAAGLGLRERAVELEQGAGVVADERPPLVLRERATSSFRSCTYSGGWSAWGKSEAHRNRSAPSARRAPGSSARRGRQLIQIRSRK